MKIFSLILVILLNSSPLFARDLSRADDQIHMINMLSFANPLDVQKEAFQNLKNLSNLDDRATSELVYTAINNNFNNTRHHFHNMTYPMLLLIHFHSPLSVELLTHRLAFMQTSGRGHREQLFYILSIIQNKLEAKKQACSILF